MTGNFELRPENKWKTEEEAYGRRSKVWQYTYGGGLGLGNKTGFKQFEKDFSRCERVQTGAGFRSAPYSMDTRAPSQ
jgi:hypothetical protein